MIRVVAILLIALAIPCSATAGQLKPNPTPTGYLYAPFTWQASGYAQPDDYVGLHVNLAGGYQTSGEVSVDCGTGYQKSTAWVSDPVTDQPATGTYEASVYVPRADAAGRVCTVSITVESGWVLLDNGQYWLATRPSKVR